jgi:hypothetical protein
MHDFIQSLVFASGRPRVPIRSAYPGWVQRGIMRSFGEDDVVAPCFSASRIPSRDRRKAKVRNRK